MGGSSKGWRPSGKVIVKDKLHGVPHTVIETKSTLTDKEQKENPMNEKVKAQPEYAKDLYLKKLDECKMWKERALESGKTIMQKDDEIEALRKTQKIPASAMSTDIGKLKEQIIELQEKLAPFKYEFTAGGSLVSVMVRPRAKEVIPLT
jgi:hypothetical protein